MSDYEKKIDEMEVEELEGDVLELVGDDGKAVNFFHIGTLDYKDKWYVVLQPTEDSDDLKADEVVIFELGTDDNGEDVFLTVEDEEIVNAVYDEFCNLDDSEEETETEE